MSHRLETSRCNPENRRELLADSKLFAEMQSLKKDPTIRRPYPYISTSASERHTHNVDPAIKLAYDSQHRRNQTQTLDLDFISRSTARPNPYRSTLLSILGFLLSTSATRFPLTLHLPILFLPPSTIPILPSASNSLRRQAPQTDSGKEFDG